MTIVYIMLIMATLELIAIIYILKKLKKAKIGKGKRVLTFLLFLLVEIFTLKMAILPPASEIEPGGPYNISSEDYWVEKPMIDTNDTNKEIQVRAWYPIDYVGASHSAKVMVFSHGSCGTIDNNLSLYQEMASYGYVVLAVAHPGHAATMTNSDGTKVSVSQEFLNEMGAIEPNKDPEVAYQIFQKWMKKRMGELNLVMDDFKMAAAQETYEFAKIADASRFIVAGHSLGGSSAYAMARTRDDVYACIALESPCMYDVKGVENGEFIFDDTPYKVPTLNIYTDSSYSHLQEWKQYKNNVMISESDNSVNIYYPGIGHMGICDLSIASPLLSAILGGEIPKVDAAVQLTKLNEDCMEFLNKIEQE